MKAAPLLAATLFFGVGLSHSADRVPPDRVALIIGNDAYPDIPLTNAVRDARAVKAMLTGKLDFPEAAVVFA